MLGTCRDWVLRVVTLAKLASAIRRHAGRGGKLVIHPQKTPAELGKWSLLPPEESRIDADAVPLYEKAVNALPGNAADGYMRVWLDASLSRLPLQRVQQTLQPYAERLKYTALAVRCRQSHWPPWKPGISVPYCKGYRRLALAIRVWIRLEIANGRYEEAIHALQIGFGMAKHLGHAPVALLVLIGTVIGQVACREIEAFVQREGAPNLRLALASLPRPFVDLESAIEYEATIAASYGGVKRGEKAAQDQCRALVKRLHSNLAALQCVEAIRSYAAAHSGQLPQTLTDITEVSAPEDPATGEAFRYTRTGATAVLESPAPAGDGETGPRYKITVKD